jgi:hypothetical protein
MEMKTENLTRKEAVLACLDGHKVGHPWMEGHGEYSFHHQKGFWYSSKNVEETSASFQDEDGYFIIQEPLTFDTIRKECEPTKHLLVDGEKRRLYLGFTRNGSLVTDHCKGAGAALWIEDEVKKWKIEKYEGER